MNVPLTLESSLAEAMANPVVAEALGGALAAFNGGAAPDASAGDAGDALGVDLEKMVGSVPLDRMIGFSGGAITAEQMEQLLAAANAQQ